uniref:Uncharacterized protein n=1 Tax=Romanomermis culicivorax TaxID=13658 RepID=A0A915HUS1_ROMCU
MIDTTMNETNLPVEMATTVIAINATARLMPLITEFKHDAEVQHQLELLKNLPPKSVFKAPKPLAPLMDIKSPISMPSISALPMTVSFQTRALALPPLAAVMSTTTTIFICKRVFRKSEILEATKRVYYLQAFVFCINEQAIVEIVFN